MDAHRFLHGVNLLPVSRPRGRDNRWLLQILRTIQKTSHWTFGFKRPRNSCKTSIFISTNFTFNVHLDLSSEMRTWFFEIRKISPFIFYYSQVIHNRLSCGAIFDFMDYLHPDTNNWSRGSEINTGIALQLAISTSWLNFFAWLVACLINFIMARKRLHDLREKFCCCCWVFR